MTDPAALTDEELAAADDYFAREREGTAPTLTAEEVLACLPSDAQVLIDSQQKEIFRLGAEVERLRESLDFYANPEHWESTLVHTAPADGPNAGASTWESGAAIDGGERARRALNVPLP